MPLVTVAVRLLDKTGIAFGAAVALRMGPAQPAIVCLTVYVPGVVTVMAVVVAPLLQVNDPVNPEAVRTELPQLLATVITGIAMVVFTGVATALRGGLVHPLTVCVTVYVPAVVTVIELVVAPLLHNNDPVNPDAVRTELVQLFVTFTTGAVTEDPIGAAVPLPARLTHPFIVWVTVYTPGVVTVIEFVVAPLLHNNVPLTPVAANTELPQLFVTLTEGVAGIALGAAAPLPALLVHPPTV